MRRGLFSGGKVLPKVVLSSSVSGFSWQSADPVIRSAIPFNRDAQSDEGCSRGIEIAASLIRSLHVNRDLQNIPALPDA